MPCLRHRASASFAAPLSSLPQSTRLPWLHPDQTLDEALRRIGDWPLLPVVSRADLRKLEGTVSLSDILNLYGARWRDRTPATGAAKAEGEP